MFIVIVLVSFTATLLSSMSGAGASMITVPTWLMLGFPLPVALAAAQISGALWTPLAARNYLNGESIDLKLLIGLILGGLIGVFFGAKVVAQFDPELLKKVVGAIILALVSFAFMKRKFGVEQQSPALSRIGTIFCAIPLGFYEAFFGSGNGIFTSSMLIKSRGFDMVLALGYYYTIAFFWDCVGATLYLYHGFGDSVLHIPASIGAVTGGYIGSRIGRHQGAHFIRICFILLGGVLGLKLLLGY